MTLPAGGIGSTSFTHNVHSNASEYRGRSPQDTSLSSLEPQTSDLHQLPIFGLEQSDDSNEAAEA